MSKAPKWVVTAALVAGLLCAVRADAQSQLLAIEGGTLIDGTGAAPVKNSVVLIEGNKIKAVGAKGKIAVPSNAKIIDATGKFVLPGLIDGLAQGNWDYQPPLWIYFGVTSIYYNWSGSAYLRHERQLQRDGKLKGPRMFLSAGSIDAAPELLRDDRRANAVLWPAGWSVRSPQEAMAAIDKRHDSDPEANAVQVYEGITPDLLRVASNEAHKDGLVLEGRSEFAVMTAANGQDITHHMAGVVRSTITKPENVAILKEMKAKHWELYWSITDGNYAYMMEPDKFDSVIQVMVKNHQFLAPTITHAIWGWGTQIPHAKEWMGEIIDFAKNTPGLEFVPAPVRHLWLTADKTSDRATGRYIVGDQVSATHPRDMEGYAKRDEFLRKFVTAGGKILGGADNSFDTATGLTTHQELEQLVYSGLTPMQALMSVTKWAAEAWHLDKEIGTIEPGKFADVITIKGDPLANIHNTRNVDVVIQDGKVVDRTFDPKWKNPLPTPPQEYVGPHDRIVTMEPH